jgi:Uma2 family endonuclease
MGSPLRVMAEVSLEIAPSSMPAPEILLTSEPRGRRAAQVSTVPLLVQIADTSLENDLGDKLRLYARAGIPEYWVADVNGRVVHQMWSPNAGGFPEERQVGFGAPVSSATMPELTIDTIAL